MSSWTKSIFSKNFTNLLLNQGVNIFATIIYTPLLFQRLGDANFGLINLAFSIIILLSIIVSYGYNLNGPIQIMESNNFKVQNFIITDILSLRIFNAITILIIFLPLIIFFGDANFNRILFFSFIILFNEALNPLFYLQGKNNIFPHAIINLFSKSIYIILVYFFIIGVNDAYLANFFYGLSASICVLVFWLNYFIKNCFSNFRLSLKKIKFRLKENFTLFLSSTSTHISLNSSLVILSFFTTNTELGRFTLSYKIAFIIRMIPVFFIQSALQNAAKLSKQSTLDFNNYVSKYFYNGLMITFSFGIFLITFSELIIEVFADEKIKYSTEILCILSLIPFLAMLNFKNIIYILVYDQKNLLNRATFISLVFMIISSFILTYYYSGYGLAIALIMTEIFSFIIHSILLKNVK